MKGWIALAVSVLLAACESIPSPAARQRQAEELAAQHHWQAETIDSGRFPLRVFRPIRPVPDRVLTVYIEGDGFAWRTRTQPSADPTPIDPVALRMALAQPEGNAVYLGRPCQYGGADAADCPARYWTDHRFAPEVIDATNRAVDSVKQRFGAQSLTLVGYSGGAAVAALLAERRHDVARLITVAGNLDPRTWVAFHQLAPLDGSLDPIDEAGALSGVQQWHFGGGKDEVVPPSLITAFARRFPEGQRPTVRIEPDYDHHCCWADDWPRLWREAH